jgi:hypothetical protein
LLLGGALGTWAQDATTAAPAATKTVEERIQELENQIQVLKEALAEPEGSIQTTIGDVKKLKTIKVSGYTQVRYQDVDKKNNAGVGTTTNTFDVKRSRLKITGTPTDNTTAVIQFDLGGDTKGNTDAGTRGKYNVTTKDAYITYTLGDGNASKNYAVTAGQFLTPFGYQLVQSSSVRETPENAQIVKTLFDAVEYDRGVKLNSGLDYPFFVEVAAMNGYGAGANVTDNNHDKAFVGRVRKSFGNTLDTGVSFYSGKAGTTGAQTETQRFGLDAQYYLQNTTLKAEYISGQDTSGKWGYYAQLAHNFTKRDTAVLMYDVQKDQATAATIGKSAAWNFGWIRALDSATRLKLFYQNIDQENNSSKNRTVTAELITLF